MYQHLFAIGIAEFIIPSANASAAIELALNPLFANAASVAFAAPLAHTGNGLPDANACFNFFL